MAVIDDYQIFHDIVNYQSINPQISGFFENLRASSQNNSASGIIETLNKMLQENKPLRIAAGRQSQKEEIQIDLLSWFELLHNIYIIKWRMAEHMNEPLKKPIFCTFSRTFENPAFYPEYWFETSQEKKKRKTLIASPTDLLIAFTRYMYDTEGAACWKAMDFNIDKYNFRCVSEPAGRSADYEDPCAKIASLIMAAHNIATGRLGLYISPECQDVDLKYAGIKTEDPTLLKYWHYDRFSRFSFIRKRELTKDAGRRKPHPEFAAQWSAMATLTEFILQEKGARATKTTCARVGLGALLRSLNKLRAENTIKENPQAVFMLNTGIELLDHENFHTMSTEEVLDQINWSQKVISADYYLKQYDIRSAEEFWKLASVVFDGFLGSFNDKYYASLHNSSADPHLKQNISLNEDSCRLLLCLEWGQLEELRGRLTGARLRNALRLLLINEDLEFHSGQLWSILHKTYQSTGEDLLLYSPRKGRKIPLTLPHQWLCTDIPAKNAPAELNIWAREILSTLTKDKNNEIVWNFSLVDFTAIQEAADKTWEIYFSPHYESAVKSRYIISLFNAKQILDDDKKDRYAGIKLVTGAARTELQRYIDEEIHSMTGGVPIDIEKEKAEFAKQGIYCFADFGPTWQRGFVILDIIARLIVTAAKSEIFAAIWNNIDERIRFITHILSATHSNLTHPFPYHIGLQGDTVLRISRGTDQRDHLSRLANHEFENLAERYCFLMSLGKCLRQEAEPKKILQSIIDNNSLAVFAAPDQLEHLRSYLK